MKTKELKNKILTVAKRMLNRQDYHEIVVEEIAKKAGVAKGTIFFHFKSKENFVKEIFESMLKDIGVLFDDIVKKEVSVIEKLKLLYDTYADYILHNTHIFMMLRQEMVKENCKMKNIARKFYRSIGGKLIPLVLQGYKEKVFKKYTKEPLNPEIIMSLVFTYGLSVAHFTIQSKNKYNYKKVKEIFWKTLLYGIIK